MIGNISRAAFFLNCRRKAHNIFDLRLDALQPAEPLTIGGAYHKGAAVLTATKDRALALQAAEDEYRERTKHVKLLPEERAFAEHNIELVRRMVNAQADMYEHDDWVVLQPEVEFCVPLPNSTHHCVFFHNILHPNFPIDLCMDVQCQQPHWFRGKSDAVLSWKSMTWILERKTSGLLGDLFWNRWYLDVQPTGYIYGVWKGAGIKPHGFIMEKVTKPRKNASDPFHVTIEREPYLRTEADLLTFETEFGQILTDMERAYVEGTHYKNTGSCFNWNRKCDFHGLCKRGYQIIPGEFRQRDPDYVENKYYEILGLPVPTPVPMEEPHEFD
jgi:hypothetical protein